MSGWNVSAAAVADDSRGDRVLQHCRVAAVWLLGICVLIGCASGPDNGIKNLWDYVPPPRATPTQTEQEKFCADVATQNAPEAFDEATRSRMWAQGYQQCMALHIEAFAR